jgi:hypothetical protein
MKFHALHFGLLCEDEILLLFGIAYGRVQYEPEAKWLHSFRVYCLFFKVELLWATGIATGMAEQDII